MPNTSIADLITNWENLVVTVKASAADIPGLSVHIGPLEQVLAEVRAMTASLETRKGIKQQEAQQRKALLQTGKDLASQARAALKAHFGIRNERLVEFGATPIRARKRTVTTVTPTPQTPTTTPSPEAKVVSSEAPSKTE